MTEEWRAVVGYEGLFEVSSLGRVRSLDRVAYYSDGRVRKHKGQLLSSWVDQDGYRRVRLKVYQNNDQQHIHRLVALAFITNDNPEVKGTVDHIDADKQNNCVGNLQWLSRSDNSKKKAFDGTAAVVRGSAKINFEIAAEIRRMKIETNLTLRQIGTMYGIDKATVWNIVNHKTWKA